MKISGSNSHKNSGCESISIKDNTTELDYKYVIKERIFKNAKNKIELVVFKETNQLYAVKLLSSKSSLFDRSLLEKEALYLSKIQGQNVIKIIEIKLDGKKFKKSSNLPKNCHYMVLEYAIKGELYEYIKLNSGLHHKIARYLFRQMINGLETIHLNNICHRDIKLDNFLFDENFKLKFSDFEFCEEIKNSQGQVIYHTDKLGTLSYMAPEFFSARMHPILNYFKIFHSGDKIDIFACGVVLFVMLTGFYPFHSAEKIDCNYRYFFEGRCENFWKNKKIVNVGANIPESAKDLLNRMFEYDANKRINLKEIKEHEFFTGDVASEKELYVYMNNLWLMIKKLKKGKSKIC